MKQHKQNFIRKIQIKNYKSIKDLTIEFHAGLNIIIGPNGTGKTNFVNAVNSVFTEKLHADLPIGFEFNIEFVNVKDEIITWSGAVQEKVFQNTENTKLKTRSYTTTAISGTTSISDNSFSSGDIRMFLFMKSIRMNLNLLSFGCPTQLDYISHFEKLVGEIIEENGERMVWWSMTSTTTVYFRFRSFTLPLKRKVNLKQIKDILEIEPQFIKHLAHFSPIKNCRVSSGYTFQQDEKIFQINHILLEFYVNDSWITWHELSDGTKRLFYIISESLTPAILGGWLLIEEPELGIHPDQLYKLMDFLKEQSQFKQIIITTHSPDVLNILENNELHKIVVTRIDKQQGTLMHHLSPQKVKKAQSYMEDLSLKDFWVHSNLETLDETAEN